MTSTDLLLARAATITAKCQVLIPKELRKQAGFREGAKVMVLAFKDRIELRPLKKATERLYPALASEPLLARDWNSKEDNDAWKDL